MENVEKLLIVVIMILLGLLGRAILRLRRQQKGMMDIIDMYSQSQRDYQVERALYEQRSREDHDRIIAGLIQLRAKNVLIAELIKQLQSAQSRIIDLEDETSRPVDQATPVLKPGRKDIDNLFEQAADYCRQNDIPYESQQLRECMNAYRQLEIAVGSKPQALAVFDLILGELHQVKDPWAWTITELAFETLVATTGDRQEVLRLSLEHIPAETDEFFDLYNQRKARLNSHYISPIDYGKESTLDD